LIEALEINVSRKGFFDISGFESVPESIEGQPPALRLLFYYRNTLTISLTQALEIKVSQKSLFGLGDFDLEPYLFSKKTFLDI
jgi:hypothetical protein